MNCYAGIKGLVKYLTMQANKVTQQSLCMNVEIHSSFLCRVLFLELKLLPSWKLRERGKRFSEKKFQVSL